MSFKEIKGLRFRHEDFYIQQEGNVNILVSLLIKELYVGHKVEQVCNNKVSNKTTEANIEILAYINCALSLNTVFIPVCVLGMYKAFNRDLRAV